MFLVEVYLTSRFTFVMLLFQRSSLYSIEVLKFQPFHKNFSLVFFVNRYFLFNYVTGCNVNSTIRVVFCETSLTFLFNVLLFYIYILYISGFLRVGPLSLILCLYIYIYLENF